MLSKFFFSNLPNGQDWLIQRMLAAGYAVPSQGICFGLSHVGIQAALANDLQRFWQRLHLIATCSIQDFSDSTIKLLLIKEEIYAFFDTIFLHQKGYLYPELFEKEKRPKEQHFLSTYPLVAPLNLPNISNPFTCSGVYSPDELIVYFEILEDILIQQSVNSPVVFILQNGNHTVAVCYQPQHLAIKTSSKKLAYWHLIDANFLSCSENLPAKDTAQRVFKSLSKNKCVLFCTNIYLSLKEDNSEFLTELFSSLAKRKDWKNIHQPSAEKISFIGANSYTWSLLAAHYDSQSLTSLLQQLITIPNKKMQMKILKQTNPTGWNILMICLRLYPKHALTLMHVLKGSEDVLGVEIIVKQANGDGWNALMIGLCYCSEAVEDLLILLNTLPRKIFRAVLTQCTAQGENCLMIAAMTNTFFVPLLLKIIDQSKPRNIKINAI
ncbi:MAG: hypothetical protein H2069_05275 [Legionella sp.]|nr:hypothetical protein [Legionella sp.]